MHSPIWEHTAKCIFFLSQFTNSFASSDFLRNKDGGSYHQHHLRGIKECRQISYNPEVNSNLYQVVTKKKADNSAEAHDESSPFLLYI